MRGIEHIPWLYDAGMAMCERLGMRGWRVCVAGAASGRVLEVGCGTGRTLPYYPVGSEIWAIEPDRPALRRAGRRGRRATLVAARAEALPFPRASFDTVTTTLSFCSVDDVPWGLAEIHRVLRDDGELRMLEHVRSPGVAGRLQDWIQPAWTRLSGGCRLNRHTEGAVEGAGFQIKAESRRASGVMRCFAARKRSSAA